MAAPTAGEMGKKHLVERKDLPICCPTPDAPLWNAHPKVYLSFKDDEAHCPYCGAVYLIKEARRERRED